MIITSKINMDLARIGVPETIPAVQDDKYSRNLEFTLLDNGVAYDAAAAATSARVCYLKPDGTGGEYDALPDGTAACAIEGNVVTVKLAPQVLTVPGRVELCVALISGETELNTFAVRVDVQRNPGLQATSQNYFKVAGALADAGWTPNMYLGTDESGNVVVKNAPEGTGGGATVDEVLDAMPTVTAIDFSNFENGSFTETVDGEVITHTVTFDDSGRPVTIDDLTIIWEAAE